MKIGLIPVLEIPIPEDVWDGLGPTPPYPRREHLAEWNTFIANALFAAGYAEYAPVSRGYSFYRATDITLVDLRRIIDRHLQPGYESHETIVDSVALFGGLSLFLDGQLILVPQCCSTLADIASWKSIVAPDFKQGFFCPEGHPNPEAIRRGESLEIRCQNEEDEPFHPPAPSSVTIPVGALRGAVERAVSELRLFARTLDTLSAEYKVEDISQYLVWRES